MSWMKRIFSKSDPIKLAIIDDLNQMIKDVMPEIHPQDYDYKESLLKKSIKFKTKSFETQLEMQQKTGLKSVILTKRTSRESIWKASYTEFVSLYSSPSILFMQKEVTRIIELLGENREEAHTFESIIKYEETVHNIRNVLHAAKIKDGRVEKDVLEPAIHLLQQVIYAIEVELHERKASDKKQLLEKLKLESKYVDRQ